MKNYIIPFVSVILLSLLIGCDKEIKVQNQLDTNPITLNCKFEKDSVMKNLFIYIDKSNIELTQNFSIDIKFFDIKKEITPTIITLKGYSSYFRSSDPDYEFEIQINRFTNEIKETLRYLPKIIKEKDEPIQLFSGDGKCETLKDKQF